MAVDDDGAALMVAALPAVPAVAQAGFFKAISHLFGGTTSYLNSWLRRAKQSVDDKTDAKSLVVRAVAEAAAKRASSDSEIVEAAIGAYLPKELRRFENKVKVVEQAATTLIESDEDTIPSDEEIDQDWLNLFERYCEDASSARMQEMWGRVLAGQVRDPKKFSKSTIRLISEIEQDTAEFFEEYCALSIDGFVFDIEGLNLSLHKLIHLENAGLITGASGTIGWSAGLIDDVRFALPGRRLGLFGKLESGTGVSITASGFTQAGKQISTLVAHTDEEPILVRIADYLKNRKPSFKYNEVISGVALCKMTHVSGKEYSLSPIRTLWGESPFPDN